MKWRFAIPAVVFVALLSVFWFMLRKNQEGYDIHAIQSPLLGRAAPQFQLSQVETPANVVDNSKFHGHAYLLNVWATWCVGCRQEHQTLLAIAKENLVPIVGVDWNDDLQSAQTWLSTLGNPYIATGFDVQGKVAIDWGVYGAPETFLIDASGTVKFKHTGPLTMEVWEQKFVPLIKQAASVASQTTP